MIDLLPTLARVDEMAKSTTTKAVDQQADAKRSTLGPIANTFAKHMAKLRTAQALSGADLAAKADISRQFVWEIETGKKEASLTIAWKIAQALGVPLHDMLPKRKRRRNSRPTLTGGSHQLDSASS